MADLPAKPANRKEEYLSSIAGLTSEVPPCPYSREEAYLDAIDGKMDGIEFDIDELNDKIAALATDFSYKGSKPTYADLPADPAVGDVWTVSDTGIMYVWDGSRWQPLNMSGQEVKQSDWAENDSTDPAYIKNRTHYEETTESTLAQYGSTSAGSTPDSNYVWFIEKVEGYSTETDLSNFEDGDIINTTFTYSVNGVTREDSTELVLAIEDGHYNLDSTAPAGTRWRGAYLSELDGDTTFRWPVLAADSSATVYMTGIRYEKIKKLDAKYIPVDGETITVNADGELESAGGSSVNVVQTTGTSTTDVMSQNAVTSMVFADPGNKLRVRIGDSATISQTGIAIGGGNVSGASAIAIGTRPGGDAPVASGALATVVGPKAQGTQEAASAYGYNARATARGSVALGASSRATVQGQFDIGSTSTSYGYDSSNYRLLTGLYDGQSAHDAATVGQALGTSESLTIATSDWTALSASDPYTYQATVTATTTIGANSTVELLNDSPVDFATYGFAIGAVDTTNNTVTVYAIGQPDASKTLTINVKG